jgi:hypothetical protein
VLRAAVIALLPLVAHSCLSDLYDPLPLRCANWPGGPYWGTDLPNPAKVVAVRRYPETADCARTQWLQLEDPQSGKRGWLHVSMPTYIECSRLENAEYRGNLWHYQPGCRASSR